MEDKRLRDFDIPMSIQKEETKERFLKMPNDSEEKQLPNIDGLTYGEPKYDAVFITHYHRRPLWAIE